VDIVASLGEGIWMEGLGNTSSMDGKRNFGAETSRQSSPKFGGSSQRLLLDECESFADWQKFESFDFAIL
jgi:hypothetical protein